MKRLRTWLANLFLSATALAFALGAAEAAFRIAPELLLPKGIYSAGHYMPELMTSVYDAPVLYNRARFVRRVPNSDGFLDVEHALEKPPGTLRIGFFGDSYVESMQVPLDQVFYRRMPEQIAGRTVETLGFGMSGWGTLHAFIAYKHYAPRYDLDAAAYVFVENDLGDNALEIQGETRVGLSPQVYATLSPFDPGYELVLRNPPEALPEWVRIGKAIEERTLLGRLAWSRFHLLLSQGVRLRAEKADVEMATRAGRIPTQNDLPSTWPAPYAERARELGRRILLDWKRQAERDRRYLFVVYVPRGEASLRETPAQEDSWRPWLEQTTRELGLPLVDLREPLARTLEAGESVYGDHWTPAGHRVAAEAITAHLDSWLQSTRRYPVR